MLPPSCGSHRLTGGGGEAARRRTTDRRICAAILLGAARDVVRLRDRSETLVGRGFGRGARRQTAAPSGLARLASHWAGRLNDRALGSWPPPPRALTHCAWLGQRTRPCYSAAAMPEPPSPDRLLAQVARRRALARLLAASGRAALVLGAVHAAATLATRWWLDAPGVTAHPAWFTGLVAVAVGLGLRQARFGDRREAARAVDAHAAADDLFLTWATLAHAPQVGRAPAHTDPPARVAATLLRPLVEESAGARARGIDARAAARAHLAPGARTWLAAIALTALSWWLVPVRGASDPQPPATKKADLVAKAAARVDALRKLEVRAPQSPAVEAAREELARVLANMPPPSEPREPVELRQVEERLARLWQEAKARQADTQGRASPLGSAASARTQEWKNELRDGKVDALRQRLADATAKGKTADTDATRAQAAAREIKAFAGSVGAAGLEEAMGALLEALQAQDASPSDLEQLGERAGLELEALRQAGSDLAALEQALRTEQLAEGLLALDAPLPELDPDAALEEYERAMEGLLAEELEGLEACEDCEGGG